MASKYLPRKDAVFYRASLLSQVSKQCKRQSNQREETRNILFSLTSSSCMSDRLCSTSHRRHFRSSKLCLQHKWLPNRHLRLLPCYRRLQFTLSPFTSNFVGSCLLSLSSLFVSVLPLTRYLVVSGSHVYDVTFPS